MTSGLAELPRHLAELDRQPPAVRLLAAHAALPAAVNAELLRHLRDNFLLDGPEQERLPVTAESEAMLAQLLLSALFTQVDDELYEMRPSARAVLLRELQRIDGGARVAEVAALLERYTLERSDWPEELRWAQRVSARVVAADPRQVQEWLAAGAAQGGGVGLDRRWFSAMRTRLEQDRAVAAAVADRDVRSTLVAVGVQQLPRALAELTPDYESLAEFLGVDLRRWLPELAPPSQHRAVIRTVVHRALGEGWLDELISAAVARWPYHELLRPLLAAGLSWTPVVGTAVAEIRSARATSARAFRVTSYGLWVTPAHVVNRDRSSWRVWPRGQREPGLDTGVVAVDVRHDVALLWTGGHDWLDPPLSLGSTAGLPAGAALYAAGAPLPPPRPLRLLALDLGEQWGLQFDHDMGRGSSGCPLLDVSGRVVGMMAAARTSEGGEPIGYAVPAEAMLAVLAAELDPRLRPADGLTTADARLYLQLAEVAQESGNYRRAHDYLEVTIAVSQRTGAEDVRTGAAELLSRLPERVELSLDLPEGLEAVPKAPSGGRVPVPAEVRALARGVDQALGLTDPRMGAAALARRLDAARVRAEARRGDPVWRAAAASLLTSTSVGERLVGIVLLQVEPDPELLDALAARTNPDTDPYQVGYHALRALGTAAERLPPEHLDALERALRAAAAQHARSADTDSEHLLRRATEVVAERRRAVRAEPPSERTRTEWKLWSDRSVLRVRFLGGSRQQQAQIRALAEDWLRGTGLSFVFLPLDSAEPAEIRVAVTAGEMSWSYLGNSALAVPANQPTMSLDVPMPLTGWHRQQLLREIGHALGLVAEHQQPNADLPWDRAAVLHNLTGPPNHWTREMVENFLRRYEFPVPPKYRPFSLNSIMMHYFERTLFRPPFDVPMNTRLTGADREFIARLYPPASSDEGPPEGSTPSETLAWLRAVVLGAESARDPQQLELVLEQAEAMLVRPQHADLDAGARAELRVLVAQAALQRARDPDARLDALDRAIELAERAVAVTSPQHATHAAALLILATALADRGSDADLSRVIELFRRAAEAPGATAGQIGAAWSALGEAYLRSAGTGPAGVADLDRAVVAFESAVRAAEPGTHDLVRYQVGLGEALAVRGELTGRPSDSRAACMAYRTALEAAPAIGELTRVAAAGLARTLRTRAERDGSGAAELAAELYRDVVAAHDGESWRAEEHYRSAAELGHRLVAADPDEREWQHDLAFVRRRLAGLDPPDPTGPRVDPPCPPR